MYPDSLFDEILAGWCQLHWGEDRLVHYSCFVEVYLRRKNHVLVTTNIDFNPWDIPGPFKGLLARLRWGENQFVRALRLPQDLLGLYSVDARLEHCCVASFREKLGSEDSFDRQALYLIYTVEINDEVLRRTYVVRNDGLDIVYEWRYLGQSPEYRWWK